MDSSICQTFTASPAKPGDLPWRLGPVSPGREEIHYTRLFSVKERVQVLLDCDF